MYVLYITMKYSIDDRCIGVMKGDMVVANFFYQDSFRIMFNFMDAHSGLNQIKMNPLKSSETTYQRLIDTIFTE